MKLKDSVTRRRLLESTTHGMLMLPLLRLFKMDEALGADAILPRAMFVHWPCGTYNSSWWPAGGTGAIGALPQASGPLDAIKADLVMFKGVCLRGDSNHDGGPYQVLAAWGRGSGVHFPVEAPDPTPYSLDQRLADRWGAKTARPSVLLGATTSIPALRNAISYKQGGAPVPMQDNPKAAFNDIFGGFSLAGVSGGSSQLALAQDNVLTGKKRLVDYLRNDIKKIKSVLGPLEGAQFEAHVSSLDDIAKEIAKQEVLNKPNPVEPMKPMNPPTPPNPMNPMNPMNPPAPPAPPAPKPSDGRPPKLAQCNPNELRSQLPSNGGMWYHQTSMLPTVYKLNRQIMVQAMACGITRVGVMSFGISDTTMDFGSGGSYHTQSHGGGGTFYGVQASFMREVVELVKGFQSVKIGDRTLWDEVLLMGSTDVGDDPNAHDNVNIACFLAGRLGGKLKGNRMISYPYNPRDWGNMTHGLSYNKVLQTFAALVGENIDKIGSAAYGGVIKEV